MSDKKPEDSHSVSSTDSETLNDENVTNQFPPTFEDMVISVKGGASNYAYKASPDEDKPPPSHDHHSRETSRSQSGLFHSEEKARADFMSISRPRRYQRSVSEGPNHEKDDSETKTYISMSTLPSGSGCKVPDLITEETNCDIELAENIMSSATGVEHVDVILKREFSPNRYDPSWKNHRETSFNPKASGSRDSFLPESERSSSLSTATTDSDEQRKNRVTITPLLDEYYRNRPTAIVADNPTPSDREVLVDNEAPVDRGPLDENPPENPQDGGGVSMEDGWMEAYFKYTKIIVNSRPMIFIWALISCWSSFCIYWGIEFMKVCVSMDTIPLILVFLGITSLFTCLTRMLHITLHNTTDYSQMANVVQCVQSVMFLSYFVLYLLDLASFFVLDLQSLSDRCTYRYYSFMYWNVWVQMPVVAILIILHGPSVYRSKWYCGTVERT